MLVKLTLYANDDDVLINPFHITACFKNEKSPEYTDIFLSSSVLNRTFITVRENIESIQKMIKGAF